MKFTVFVADNFHYMDESERHKHGEYESADAAVAAAQEIGNRSLRELHTWSMGAEELTKQYCFFGEDPYIFPSDPAYEFSARDPSDPHTVNHVTGVPEASAATPMQGGGGPLQSRGSLPARRWGRSADASPTIGLDQHRAGAR